jgi:hypothetical protein
MTASKFDEGKEWKFFHPKDCYPLSVKEALADFSPTESHVEVFKDIPWPFAVKRLTGAARRLAQTSQGRITLGDAKELVADLFGMPSWKTLRHALADIEAYDVWQHFNPNSFFYHKLIDAKTRELLTNEPVRQLLEPTGDEFWSPEILLRRGMRRFLETTWPVEAANYATPAQKALLSHTLSTLQAMKLPEAEYLVEKMWRAPAGAARTLASIPPAKPSEPWIELNTRLKFYAYSVVLDILRSSHPEIKNDYFWLTGKQFRKIAEKIPPEVSAGVSRYTTSWPMLCQLLPDDAAVYVQKHADFGALGVTAIICEQPVVTNLKRLGWYPDYSWKSSDWTLFHRYSPLATTIKRNWALAVGRLL